MINFHQLLNISTSSYHNWTTPSPSPNSEYIAPWIAFLAAFVAVFGFGSNFIPVKKYDMGDGIFFQWILSSSIWFVGVIVNWIQGFPKFYPLAMLGGAMWTTGCLCVVPIFRTVGMGLGVLIWATFNLFSGWVTGRFGFGLIKPQVPPKIILNYVGVAISVVSVVIYFFVKSEVDRPPSKELHITEKSHLLSDSAQSDDLEIDCTINQDSSCDNSSTIPADSTSAFDNMSPLGKRIIGIILSVFSGTLYGLAFTPAYYIMDNYENSSQRGLDYVFGHFTGIFATSTVYFIIYCMATKNKPYVNSSAILPTILSGIIWAISDAAWFVANQGLSEAVSFPIVTAAPAALNAFWGVVLFKEIKGRKNFLILGIAIFCTVTGVVITAISKI